MLSQEKWVSRIIVVNPDGSVVAQRRPKTAKFGADKISLVGGKHEPTDTTRKDTARREVIEELGLTHSTPEFLFLMASEENGWLSYFFLLLLSEPYQPPTALDHHEFEEIILIPSAQISEYAASEEIAFVNHRLALEKYLQVTHR